MCFTAQPPTKKKSKKQPVHHQEKTTKIVGEMGNISASASQATSFNDLRREALGSRNPKHMKLRRRN